MDSFPRNVAAPCCKVLLLLKADMKWLGCWVILWQGNSVLVNEQRETTDKFRNISRHSQILLGEGYFRFPLSCYDGARGDGFELKKG